jgi:hypothetical protein
MDYMDQSRILAGGQALVPDLLERDLKMRLGSAQASLDTAQAADKQQEVAEQQSFQQAFEALSQNPSPQAWAALAARFPKHAAGIKTAFAMSQEPQNKADQTRMGEMYVAARNGRWDLVERTLADRVKADREAGHESPEDVEALTDIQSGDPAKRQRVTDMIGMHLAMTMGSEHFASAYGALGLKPEAPPELQQDYEFMVRTAGKDAADRWLAGKMDPTKWIPVTEGGKVIPVSPGGPVAQVTSPAPVAPPVSAPVPPPMSPPVSRRPQLGAFNRTQAANFGSRFGTVTSTVRSPRHNAEVGGARNSFHLARNGGRAIDIARRTGVSHAEIVREYQAAGYTLHPDTRDEGDHSHIVVAAGPSGQAGIPRVRSAQQYGRLPKGAQFYDPDGHLRVKS